MRPFIPISLLLATSGCSLLPFGKDDPETTDPETTLFVDVDGDGLRGEEERRLGTDPHNPDTDADGLTDGREVHETFTDPLNPDYDGDGLLDGEEVDVYGSDPANNDTDGDSLHDGDEVHLYGSDPTLVDTDADGLDDPREVELGTNPALADTDGDGLNDADELALGTNPLNPDTDGDGLQDGAEVALGTNPLLVDSDGDTLTDGQEVNTYGTNPLDADTDGDSLNDNIEIGLGSNPLLQDTDGDGLSDAREVREGNCDVLDQDTDNDGILDGPEVNEYGTDCADSDTDDDGLNDYDEVNVYFTDPLSADPDDDGLIDPDELTAGTDPFVADTDADGLKDGQEVHDHGTDPLDSDSDDDGLTDGDEVRVHRTDPNDPDTDDDALTDGDEVNVWFSDPLVADTDGDGLLDGEDVAAGASPLLPDTDYGGVPDAQEVNDDGTDPADPSDDVCTYRDLALVDSTYVPPTPNFDPRFISFDWELVANDNGVFDFFLDANGDGTEDAGETSSARLRFNLFGPEWDYLCAVEFDANDATPIASPAWNLLSFDGTASAASLVQALQLTPSNGVTDCPRLNATVYGSSDIRTVLASQDFGFGFGGLGVLRTTLRDEVLAAGQDWTNDWAPAVHGGWLTWDDTDAHLVGFGFVHDAVCGDVDVDGAGAPVRQAGFEPLQPGHWASGYAIGGSSLGLTEESFGVTSFFDFEDVTGIACNRANVAVGDASWSTGSATMGATRAALYLDAIIEGDGTLGDFRRNIDADAALESVGGKLTAIFVNDSYTTEYCRIEFDTANAVVVDDPADWTALNADGTAGGPIYRAWTLDLVDGKGSTNCGLLDLANGWPDTDPATVLANITFGFGIGPTGSWLDNEASIEYSDWSSGRSEDTFALYTTVDNGAAAYALTLAFNEDVDDCFNVDEDVNNPPSWLRDGRIGRAFSYGKADGNVFVGYPGSFF